LRTLKGRAGCVMCKYHWSRI